MDPLLLTVAFLVVVDPPAKPISARPTALVLTVKGEVLVGQRRVEPGDYLLPGEVVVAGADAEALLVFLVRGESRRLKPGRQAKLTRDGCEPADAVETVAARPRLTPRNLTKVREVEVREGGGVGVLRGSPPAEARVTPLYGTFILTNRPSFTWPSLPKVEGYTIELKDVGGKRLWKLPALEARLAFPAEQKPLEWGQKYLWSVQAKLPGGEEKTIVDESNFKLLLPGELEALAGVRKLTASDDPPDLLLAAAAFEGYGLYDEALTVFEKLARLQPGVARYQAALARYYQHAGRTDRAKEAEEKAKKLRVQAGK